MKVSLLGLLGIAFVILKLTDVIDWSWWWVTCPFWIGIPLFILFAIIHIAILKIREAVISRQIKSAKNVSEAKKEKIGKLYERYQTLKEKQDELKAEQNRLKNNK